MLEPKHLHHTAEQPLSYINALDHNGAASRKPVYESGSPREPGLYLCFAEAWVIFFLQSWLAASVIQHCKATRGAISLADVHQVLLLLLAELH